MDYADENQHRKTADEIGHQWPGWIVLWGCYSHQFVAFPLFPALPGAIVAAHYPDGLTARMQDIEQRKD